jgi:hypothetical protein
MASNSVPAGANASGVVSRLSAWATMPLTQGVNVGTASLFLVLAICAAIIWTRVLKHVVKDAVMEIT